MDAQITSSVIGGVVGAIAGGIVPYLIYLSTEKKKKKEKQLENLLMLRTEIENLGYKSMELKFRLQITNKEKSNPELIEAVNNIRIFRNKDLLELDHIIPHYALYIDSETLTNSKTFLENINEKFSEIERKMIEVSKERQNGADGADIKEKNLRIVDNMGPQLELISRECDNFRIKLSNKVDHYYKEYQKKYIKI